MIGWAASYLGSTWALILIVVLIAAALGAVAFFARNWKAIVAAILLVAAGFAYLQIDKNAYQRRVSEEAAAKVEQLESRLAALQKQAAADADRAALDAKYIETLEKDASETPPNVATCLDAATAKRIGAIR